MHRPALRRAIDRADELTVFAGYPIAVALRGCLFEATEVRAHPGDQASVLQTLPLRPRVALPL